MLNRVQAAQGMRTRGQFKTDKIAAMKASLFVVMFASIFGTFVPMTLEKLKIDPAIATGPFISITNDIIGMMLYMGITVLLS